MIRNELLAVSQVLLQKETLDKEEVFQVLEQVKTGEFETLPLDQFETLASSRTPEKIKLLIKEEQDKRRTERERLRHLEQLKKSAEQNEQERPRDERFYG